MNSNRQKIIDNVDIVSEIQKYIDVTPKGSNYVALCPFHIDSNPSMSISPEKKIFKCFVCSEGGDVVSFVSKFEKISQSLAMEKIAKENRIKIDIREKKVQNTPLNFLINDISVFYQSSLLVTPAGKVALNYLEKRNISLDTIKHFKLGYGYNVNGKLYEYLEKKISTNNQYSDFDISSINQFNNKNDMFSNRVTIPIIKDSHIVGFGARDITNSQVKYINSKDSELFRKSEVIYNLDSALMSSMDKSLIVTEGYFDVISAYQNGVKNVCAIMGTSFTQNHVNKIKNKINTVYLALDSDNAGQNSTLKIGKMLDEFLTVKIINFSSVKDLDEYFQNHDSKDFEILLKQSMDYKIYEMKELIKRIDINNYEQKDIYIKRVMQNLNKKSELLQEDVKSFLVSNLNITKEYLNNIQSKSVISQHKYEPQNQKQIRNNKDIPIDFEDRIILKMLSSKKEYQDILELISIHNVKLIKNINLFENIKEYYNENDDFDFVTFSDMKMENAKLLQEIYTKEQVSDVLTSEELIVLFKNRKKGFNLGGLKI